MADDALSLFLRDGAARIALIADPGLANRVPPAFRSAAASIARQGAGTWAVGTMPGGGFKISTADREFLVGEDFQSQCEKVTAAILTSSNPDLRLAVSRLYSPQEAVMSAFFHYFMTHELLHIEQGLGSDQYLDSEFYMPIVMEADHVADVAGLAIATSAHIPEIAPLNEREQVLLLIAIHLASMHSFGAGAPLDTSHFSRLLTWYVHFARFQKSSDTPDLASITMLRPWLIVLPRLIGREDQQITQESLAARISNPYEAHSDVVVAYHGDDGIFRIHRAVLTDPERIGRLCSAIVKGDFDKVRRDLEEVLVNNPALVPTLGRGTAPDVEWAAGAVLERLEVVRNLMPDDRHAAITAAEDALRDFAQLTRATRATTAPPLTVETLLNDARKVLEELCLALGDADSTHREWQSPRIRALSLIDQIVVEHTG